jgi:hypothetical protein
MSVTPWFRTYNRMVDDEKLRLLAFEDRWHFMALCCLKNEGLLDEPEGDLKRRKIAVRMGLQVRELEEVGRRLREVELIDANLSPMKWDELQKPSDNSSERVKKFRQKQRDSKVKRDETVTETDGNAKYNALEVEIETEVISPNGESPSSDEPALSVEEVFKGYQALASDLGLAVPRDLTPERRQLVRGRISQYALSDFQAVFARCRASPFLRGDKGRTPLTFDWLMKKGNFQKTLEGNYDD